MTCCTSSGTSSTPEHPAHEKPGDALAKTTGRTISQELEHLRALRTAASGHLLCRYFNVVWAMCSDAFAWSVPGWGELCDLCSEEWALDEERSAVA
jgi:hypothetical protein